MNSYVVSCCSTADLTEEHFRSRDIHYICFHYELDGKQYPDDLGKSMPFPEFYAAMANATAGLATLEVSTPSRLPWPPARSIAIISFLTTVSPLEVYFSKRFLNAYKCVVCTILNSCFCLL